jgi:DNA primase
MATPVELIKERINVLDLVSSYVKLHKAGKHWKGRSPFTNEKTPSFFVSPERGMYYCFSSGKGGDIFTFVQEMEGVDFRGALTILAERAGIELVPERPEDRTLRETLFAIMEEATTFYRDQLSKHGEEQAYLRERGVSEVSEKVWHIGYAPDEWRSVRTHLISRGFTPEHILLAGLTKQAEGSGEAYDVFRNRIMFPIRDASGRTVGFSGRDRSGEVNAPKYVNSPESQLFEKSRILFGYDKAKHGIRTLDFTLVVEGQFDLVLSHQAGYSNTVAISGTAMTPSHIELIGRLSKNAVLALDADRAGLASAKRSAALMLERDMDVKVARIQGGKDPADLVRESPALLKEIVRDATHVIPFLLGVLSREESDERTFKLRVRQEVVPFVTSLPNRIDAEHFEGVIAESLHTTKDAIHFEVERVREQKQKELTTRSTVKSTVTQTHSVRGSTHTTLHTPSSPHRSTSHDPTGVQESGSTLPPEHSRIPDIAAHLYGVLLWQQGLPSPQMRTESLREHLENILGKERFNLLDLVPDVQKHKYTFLAESAYEDTSALQLRDTLTLLLNELHMRLLRDSLREVTASLRNAEDAGERERVEKLLSMAHQIQQSMKEAAMPPSRFLIPFP